MSSIKVTMSEVNSEDNSPWSWAPAISLVSWSFALLGLINGIIGIIESKNFEPYYVVDGQQRLTTLLLLLIKLYHIGIENETGINIPKFIGERIYEEDMASEKHFKISNEDRNLIIRKIFEKDEIGENDITNITQANLVENFEIISKYFDKFFFKESEFDKSKYCYYIYFLLEKVLIIEILLNQMIQLSEFVQFFLSWKRKWQFIQNRILYERLSDLVCIGFDLILDLGNWVHCNNYIGTRVIPNIIQANAVTNHYYLFLEQIPITVRFFSRVC